jgi:hypothetical protein
MHSDPLPFPIVIPDDLEISQLGLTRNADCHISFSWKAIRRICERPESMRQLCARPGGPRQRADRRLAQDALWTSASRQVTASVVANEVSNLRFVQVTLAH